MLIQYGTTFILEKDGTWVELEKISRIPPVQLSNELVLSWEPGLRTRYLDGGCCVSCLKFFEGEELSAKLLDGYCEECAFPPLWTFFK